MSEASDTDEADVATEADRNSGTCENGEILPTLERRWRRCQGSSDASDAGAADGISEALVRF